MGKLSEILQSEIDSMSKSQIAKFRRELAKTLPQAVKSAADKAKQAPEKPQAEGMSKNVRKK